MVADMAVVATAYTVANALGATPKVMLSLFEAGLVESGFRNLDYGDRDSLGYLQQRPSQGWPNPTDVATATKSYVNKAKKNNAKHPSWSAGRLAQSVQISAFPHRYDQREDDARALLAKAQGLPGTPDSSTPGFSLPGLPDVGLIDAVTGIADGVRTMATGAVNVGGLATQLAKLALPSNIIRAAAGGMGIILIFTGIAILGRQVKA